VSVLLLRIDCPYRNIEGDGAVAHPDEPMDVVASVRHRNRLARPDQSIAAGLN
jgi:hypothetical protein